MNLRGNQLPRDESSFSPKVDIKTSQDYHQLLSRFHPVFYSVPVPPGPNREGGLCWALVTAPGHPEARLVLHLGGERPPRHGLPRE